MKKSTYSILISLCFSIIYAQENVDFSGEKKIISPEIHDDNTVTFRFEAPNAKKVFLEGDFLSQQGLSEGKTEMKKNEKGIWTYTTSNLLPELYSYKFIADGLSVNDPNNVHFSRDVATVVNIFIVPGGKADLYKVNDVPHGTVSKRWYESPTLKMNRRLTVYTPPGYEKSKENFPVLYLLHGAGGDEEAWITLGRTAQILDNLIAQGKAKPMLVVMPNGNASQSAAPGESKEGFYTPDFIQPDMFSGNTEKAFGDVIQFIESEYRVKKEKSSRAIAGLSMGGFHTIIISTNYPKTFDYMGVFSAALFQPKEADSEMYLNIEKKLKAQKENNYKLYWKAIGKTDFLYKEATDFRNLLNSMNFNYTYKESEGGHTWSNWRDYLSEFAPLLFR